MANTNTLKRQGEMTQEEKAKTGQLIAELFNMQKARHSTKNNVLIKTAWGTKTYLGIYEVFQRVNKEIADNTFHSL
jgi:hypothetical protein